MSTKFKSFVEALNLLCKEHSVQLCTSGYDGLQVWDLKEGEDPIYSNGIEDKTARADKTPPNE